MPDNEVYEYAFIRFVPRVEREEFINVGVALLCKRKKFLDVKFHIDETRIKALFPDVEIEELAAYLNTWKLISVGNKDGGPIAELDLADRFRWLTASRSTTIQASKVHPGRTCDPAAVLEDLFEKYVK